MPQLSDKKLPELKALAAELDLTPDYVREFGNLSHKVTWILAIDAATYTQNPAQGEVTIETYGPGEDCCPPDVDVCKCLEPPQPKRGDIVIFPTYYGMKIGTVGCHISKAPERWEIRVENGWSHTVEESKIALVLKKEELDLLDASWVIRCVDNTYYRFTNYDRQILTTPDIDFASRYRHDDAVRYCAALNTLTGSDFAVSNHYWLPQIQKILTLLSWTLFPCNNGDCIIAPTSQGCIPSAFYGNPSTLLNHIMRQMGKQP